MNLYKALQSVLDKIKSNNEDLRYNKDPLAIYRALAENQERLAESILILGTVIHGIAEKDIEIEIFPDPKSLSN